jgi:hypothetical protein
MVDNHTSSRRYQGKPTTNYLSDGLSGYNVVQGSRWNGATPTFTKGMSEFNTLIGTYNTSGTSYMYSHDYVLDDDLSTLSSQVVTFSIYLRRTDTLGTVGMRIYDNVSGYSTIYADVTNQFQRFSITKTLGANPTRIFIMIDNSNGGIIDFHSPMLEKGEASPFVDGTRSSTESLIDLKRTTDIDVSNVSFDSTGQPTFDGTDDTIALGNSSQFKITDSMSVFTWIKPDDISSWNGIFGGSVSGFVHFQLYNGGVNVYLYGPNASYGSIDGVSIGTNVWTNVGFTFGNNTLKVYVNGEQLPTTVTGNGANISGNSDVRFGWAYATSRLFQGKINVATVHNRELTPEEVTQTYNSYKNRFDI